MYEVFAIILMILSTGGPSPSAPEQFAATEKLVNQITAPTIDVPTSQPSADGDLGQVSELMSQVADELAVETPYSPITKKQNRIVALLDKLIEEAEKQQQKPCCKSPQKAAAGKTQMSPSGQANVPSQTPMGDSYLPGGTGEAGQQQEAEEARPGEVWGNMPPRERKKILQSLQQSFPARYRQLIEQYYTQLGKE
jgi:hypothetical protein